MNICPQYYLDVGGAHLNSEGNLLDLSTLIPDGSKQTG